MHFKAPQECGIVGAIIYRLRYSTLIGDIRMHLMYRLGCVLIFLRFTTVLWNETTDRNLEISTTGFWNERLTETWKFTNCVKNWGAAVPFVDVIKIGMGPLYNVK